MNRLLCIVAFGAISIAAFAADPQRSCLIVRSYKTTTGDALTRWSTPKPFRYVEGSFPKGMKFRTEIGDKDIREIQSKNGKVMTLNESYSLDELKDAREQCAKWVEEK